jgi:hypothetical protein
MITVYRGTAINSLTVIVSAEDCVSSGTNAACTVNLLSAMTANTVYRIRVAQRSGGTSAEAPFTLSWKIFACTCEATLIHPL